MFYHQLPLSKKNKKRYKEELEERLVSLVASLFGKEAGSLRTIYLRRHKYFAVLVPNMEFLCLHL